MLGEKDIGINTDIDLDRYLYIYVNFKKQKSENLKKVTGQSPSRISNLIEHWKFTTTLSANLNACASFCASSSPGPYSRLSRRYRSIAQL